MKSKEIADNVYEFNYDAGDLIYAPLKNLIAKKWIIFSKIQMTIIKKTPDLFDIPNNVMLPTVLELDMSHGCSLNCIYCSVNSNSKTDKELRMSFDLAKVALDELFNNSKKAKEDFAVVFIGKGEPTLNWNVLIELTEYINQMKKKLGIDGKTVIVTNGIISSEKAKWIANNIDHIALSWDGDKDSQNKQRPLVSGGDSYNLVKNTALILKKEGAYFEIRSTWTSLNVEKMPEITKEFVKYKPFELNYQPLLEIGRAQNSDLSKPIVDIFVENFIQSKKIASDNGIKVMMPSVETDRLNRKFCHAYEGTGFHLSAKGEVTACECVFSKNDGIAGKMLSFGEIKNNKIVTDKHKIKKLKDIKVDKISECKNCFVRWHCAGGCLNTHFENSDDPLECRKHKECEITQKIVGRMLSNKIKKGGEKDGKIYKNISESYFRKQKI